MKFTADHQNQSEERKMPVPTDAQIEQAIALLHSDKELDGFDGYFNAEATSATDILATSRSERGVLPLFDLLLKYPPRNEIQSWRRPGMGKLIRDYRFSSVARYCRKLIRMDLSPEIRQVVAELQREIMSRSEASQKEKAPPRSWLERLLGRGK
jgi:hypothetical protein